MYFKIQKKSRKITANYKSDNVVMEPASLRFFNPFGADPRLRNIYIFRFDF